MDDGRYLKSSHRVKESDHKVQSPLQNGRGVGDDSRRSSKRHFCDAPGVECRVNEATFRCTMNECFEGPPCLVVVFEFLLLVVSLFPLLVNRLHLRRERVKAR